MQRAVWRSGRPGPNECEGHTGDLGGYSNVKPCAYGLHCLDPSACSARTWPGKFSRMRKVTLATIQETARSRTLPRFESRESPRNCLPPTANKLTFPLFVGCRIELDSSRDVWEDNERKYLYVHSVSWRFIRRTLVGDIPSCTNTSAN